MWTSGTMHLLALLVLVLLGGPAPAETFRDGQGRFMIDLPETFSFTELREGVAYTFEGDDGGSIVITYMDGESDAGAAFSFARDVVGSSLDDLSSVEDVLDLEVNGHPARRAVYKGRVKEGQQSVLLYGYVGSIVLSGGSLAFISILNGEHWNTWESRVHDAFHTIRNPGEPVTGASKERAATN